MTYEPHGERPSRRHHFVTSLVVLFVLGLGIGIGTLISHRVVAGGPGDSQLKMQSGGGSQASGAAVALSQAFEDVARRVGPCVVNIATEEVVRVPRRQGRNSQMPDMFRQFFGDMPQEYTRSSLGSGILVDPKGYILTNNHVVKGASKIKVNVKDGKEYQARVIAGDELSDIAVIKIDGEKDFPFAKIGEAKAMKVGDWVIAIGSPFGLEQTVTAGIVSAIGRVFDTIESVEEQAMLFNDYLQTDAAINPGNSGGPLVNMSGEVVGINSFINTPSRANAGVGFAVPSHIFVEVYNQILANGKVRRGWMGINMNTDFPFTPAMAEYFGVKQGSGVLITGTSDEKGAVSENTPAARAGIKAEDVIIEYDGKKITGIQDLRLAVANTAPGRTINVKAVRFGSVKDFSVTVGERTFEANQAAPGFSFEEKTDVKPEIGMRIDNVPARIAKDYNITGGALVLTVTPGGLAEDAGLRSQDQSGFDVIVAANGKKIDVYQDMVDTLTALKSGQSVVIKLLRVTLTQGGPSIATHYTSLQKP